MVHPIFLLFFLIFWFSLVINDQNNEVFRGHFWPILSFFDGALRDIFFSKIS